MGGPEALEGPKGSGKKLLVILGGEVEGFIVWST